MASVGSAVAEEKKAEVAAAAEESKAASPAAEPVEAEEKEEESKEDKTEEEEQQQQQRWGDEPEEEEEEEGEEEVFEDFSSHLDSYRAEVTVHAVEADLEVSGCALCSCASACSGSVACWLMLAGGVRAEAGECVWPQSPGGENAWCGANTDARLSWSFVSAHVQDISDDEATSAQRAMEKLALEKRAEQRRLMEQQRQHLLEQQRREEEKRKYVMGWGLTVVPSNSCWRGQAGQGIVLRLMGRYMFRTCPCHARTWIPTPKRTRCRV